MIKAVKKRKELLLGLKVEMVTQYGEIREGFPEQVLSKVGPKDA